VYSDLPDLNEDDLKELKIALGPRKRMLKVFQLVPQDSSQVSHCLVQFLQDLSLGSLIAPFCNNDVSTVEDVQSLSSRDLEMLGLTIGQRNKIFRAISALG